MKTATIILIAGGHKIIEDVWRLTSHLKNKYENEGAKYTNSNIQLNPQTVVNASSINTNTQ